MAGQIFELMPKVMAEVGAIGKDSKNAAQNYKFRGIDAVMTALQPALTKHQVFFVPEVLNKEVIDRESKNGGVLIYTTLQVAYTFYAPDGSSVRTVVVGEAMDSGDKSSNKAMSAALKYALLQVFCVPTEASDDADAHSYEVAPKAKAAAATASKSISPDAEPSPTLFWSLQREYSISKEQAQAIAGECGQDWKKAVGKLKALVPTS